MDQLPQSGLPFPEHKLQATTDKIYGIADQLKAACARTIAWQEAITHVRSSAKALVKMLEEFQQMHEDQVALIAADSFSKANLQRVAIRHEREVDEWRARLQPSFAQLAANSIVFEHLSELYEDEVYFSFLELHRRYPDHKLWSLNGSLIKVEFAAQELVDIAERTAPWIQHIRSEYRSYKRKIQLAAQRSPKQPEYEAQSATDTDTGNLSSFSTDGGSEVDVDNVPTKAKAKPAAERLVAPVSSVITSAPAVTTSFGVIEDQVNSAHPHRRAATTMAADYMLEDNSASAPRFGSVFRRTKVVPRIFTGSFSELEQSIRKMQLEGMCITSAEPMESAAATDVAKHPASSFPSSEALMLKRRDAQQGSEGLHGKTSRRFQNDRTRARTLNDKTDGLEAWLKKQPTATSLAGPSGAAKKTL